MNILEFIKEYWVQLVFFLSFVLTFLTFVKVTISSVKCSLRNDILEIYDRCKDKRKITHYQLESIRYSSELYFKLKGNSFVLDIVNRVNTFELID